MQPFQLWLQLRFESLQSLPIHTSTASVRFYLFPGHLQVLPLVHLIHNEWTFLAPVGLIQSASLLGRECTGISLMELIHLLAVTHLASSLFPTVFAGCLPRSTSDRRLLSPTAFTGVVVLHSRPSTGRASLAPSLALIGSLTLVPPRDSVSPPEVTRCSSVPCRPQSPWYGG